jgi:acyl-CoA synthetase (AMP-forming)/AMP-acid ligase II
MFTEFVPLSSYVQSLLIYCSDKTSLLRYIGNDEATAASFDDEGWYLSGDIARREGDYYFILGRASVDSQLSLCLAREL